MLSQAVLFKSCLLICGVLVIMQLSPKMDRVEKNPEKLGDSVAQGALMSEIELLKASNLRLEEKLAKAEERMIKLLLQQKSQLKNEGHEKPQPGPSANYEKFRKRLRTNIQHLWEFSQSLIRSLQQIHADESLLERLLTGIYEHKLSLLSDWQKMSMADGYEEWRMAEHKLLGDLVQKHLHTLQNPRVCNDTEVVQCKIIPKDCGWSCQVHHLAECLAAASGLNRMYLHDDIYDEKFQYGKQGLKMVLQPESKRCNLKMFAGQEQRLWTHNSISHPKVLSLPDTMSLSARPRLQYLPSAIPEQLIARLAKLEVEPSVWWLGQLKKFILRYTLAFQQKVDEITLKLQPYFKHPIVGVHVRRTDKAKEAKLISTAQYMARADEYFDKLNVTGALVKRRIFLASEDPAVFDEIRRAYPNYEILTNQAGAEIAKDRKTRNTLEGLVPFVVDTNFLIKCDFVVATFSSNVGRLVYELMHTNQHDALFRVISMDQRFSEFSENYRMFEVMMPHHAKFEGEIDLAVGEQVPIDWSNNVNGTLPIMKGRWGIAPAFKLQEIPEVVPFLSDILK